MRFTIHGVRGSVPTPGADFVKYGGNTSCFEIETSESQIFCDAGTGFDRQNFFAIKRMFQYFLLIFIMITFKVFLSTLIYLQKAARFLSLVLYVTKPKHVQF